MPNALAGLWAVLAPQGWFDRFPAMVACDHCLDIGSALARGAGVSERQLYELSSYRTSTSFDETEQLVVELAEALTGVPARVHDQLGERLGATFSPTQRTELIAAIAWEDQRARLNQGLGVRPSGFSDGGACALAEDQRPSVGRSIKPKPGNETG